MNDAEIILKRLDEKENDFLFSFLEEDSIELNELLRTGSIKELALKLKSEWNDIESLKVTKTKELYSTERNFATGKTGRPKVKKTLTIEGKTPKEVEQILTRQKRIGKVIPLLEKKILPELKIYEKLLKDNLPSSKKEIELTEANKILEAENRELKSNYESVNNEFNNAQKLIVELQKKKSQLEKKLEFKNGITISELTKIADQTRKKNGSLNFSEIGKHFSIANHTAKKYCRENHIE